MKVVFNSPFVLLTAALTLCLSGCVTTDNLGCNVNAQSPRNAKSVTTYKPARSRPNAAPPYSLPQGSVAQVSTYKLSFRPGFTKPCTTITLVKDLVIQRSDEGQVMLNEVREFYAEDGTLITSTNQEISPQVLKSGAYTGTTPLPIPKSAPPGKYKIVSKLLFERKGDRRPASLIAHAEAYFYIIPPK